MHYNLPPLAHPGSEAVIREALNHRFDGGTKVALRADLSLGQTLYSSRNKVLRRHDTAVAKHTFLA